MVIYWILMKVPLEKVAFKVQLISKLVFNFTNITELIHRILRWLFRNFPGYVTCLHCPSKVNEKDTSGSFHLSTVASLSLMRNEYTCTLAINKNLLWLLNSRGPNLRMVPELESFWLYQLSNRLYVKVCCQHYRESSAFTHLERKLINCFY